MYTYTSDTLLKILAIYGSVKLVLFSCQSSGVEPSSPIVGLPPSVRCCAVSDIGFSPVPHNDMAVASGQAQSLFRRLNAHVHTLNTCVVLRVRTVKPSRLGKRVAKHRANFTDKKVTLRLIRFSLKLCAGSEIIPRAQSSFHRLQYVATAIDGKLGGSLGAKLYSFITQCKSESCLLMITA